jgi:RNA polymerase sigma-70 factor (ECF subfamily)
VRSHVITEGAVVAAARGGDKAAFGELVERYRRELRVHCYRMLGSLDDSEDLVQETFLRAWRRLETFEGHSSFRSWLYRIATNACLDWLGRQPRRVPARRSVGSDDAAPFEVVWLQPYPDHLLEGIAASGDDPGAAVVTRETIELAFLVAIQHLPPRQRAVLILRDVLGWPANEAASLLEMSVAAANSAVQRARATLRQHLATGRADWGRPTDPSREERALVQRYMEATDRGDADAIVAILHEDVRFSMPPLPQTWVGRETVVAGWAEGGFGSPSFGEMHSVLVGANLQPAVAGYVRRPGDPEFRALALDVLRIQDSTIVEIITFDADVFPAFGLPATL